MVGWSLNELGQWFRVTREDKKLKKQILYNLLEINFILHQLDLSEEIDLITDRVLDHAPQYEQTDNNKQLINQFYSDFISGFLQNNVAKNLDKIEEKYSIIVDNLASVDPITAYQLSDKTKIIQYFDLLQEYFDKVKEQFQEDIDPLQNQIDSIFDFVKSETTKETISNIEDEIRKIAYSISCWTLYKASKTLRITKNRIKTSGKKRIDALLDQLIPANVD